MATPLAFRSIHDEMRVKNVHAQPPRRKAGHKLLGDTQSALVVAQGRLAPNASHTPSPKSHKHRRGPVFSSENALTG